MVQKKISEKVKSGGKKEREFPKKKKWKTYQIEQKISRYNIQQQILKKCAKIQTSK